MKAFIIFRDRVGYAQLCFAALRKAGFEVYVVDHASSWPAALRWLEALERRGTPVWRRGANAHPRYLWTWEPFRELMETDPEPYLVTDPDVVPSEDCPDDWPARLARLVTADGEDNLVKAGLGLRLDRIPLHFPYRDAVLAWEMQYWRGDGAGHWAGRGETGVYEASVDTTLAVYRPFAQHRDFAMARAVRTIQPYVADHLSWYENRADLPADVAWYYAHADPKLSHWASGTPPPELPANVRIRGYSAAMRKRTRVLSIIGGAAVLIAAASTGVALANIKCLPTSA